MKFLFRAVEKTWDILEKISRRPRIAALLIGTLSFTGSAVFGLLHGIFVFEGHDEYSFLLGAETFLRGRLTNPMHPFWEHFQSFHILVNPVYASGYPPAQSVFLALGLLTGHAIIGVWLSTALMCAAIYWMLRAWFPPRWAFLGGILTALHLGIYTYWSQRYWGGAPAAIGGALLFGGVRRLIQKPRASSAVLMMLGLGILANSRPFEGFISAFFALGILLSGLLRKKIQFAELIRKTFLPFLLGTAVLAGVTGFYNKAVTGNPLMLPPALAAKSESSVPVFVWQPLRPPVKYIHEIIERFEETFAKEYYLRRRTAGGFISSALTVFDEYRDFFFGSWGIVILGLTLPRLWKFRWPRWFLSILIVFCAVTVLPLAIKPQRHYLAPLTGIVIALLTYGLRCFYPLKYRGAAVGKFLILAILLGAAVPRDSTLMDYISSYALQKDNLLSEFKQMGGKHLVFVRYGPAHYTHNEWVYNDAEIDQSQVVWARAMNPEKDRQLMDYYKDRNVWVLTVDDDENPELKPYKVSREFAFFVPSF